MVLRCLRGELGGGRFPGHAWEGRGAMRSLYGKGVGLDCFRLRCSTFAAKGESYFFVFKHFFFRNCEFSPVFQVKKPLNLEQQKTKRKLL